VACYEKAKIKFDDDAARRAKDVVASMNANLERFISVMTKPQPAVVDDDEPLPPPDDDDEPNDANAFLTAQQQRMAHFQEVFDQEAKKEEKFDELVDKLYNEGADQGGLAGWRSKTQSLTQLIPEAYWMADAATNNCLDCSLLFTNQDRRHHCRTCRRILPQLLPGDRIVSRRKRPHLSPMHRTQNGIRAVGYSFRG